VILRSLKMVHYRGVPEIVQKDVGRDGAVLIPVPENGDLDVVAEAVLFAFGVAPGEGVVDPSQGFAYVEVGLAFPTNVEASLFRGVDRRGVVQASLRENGGARVTGGVEPVAERLAELLNGDLAQCVASLVVQTDGAPAAPSVAAAPPSLAAGDDAAREAAAEQAREAIVALQRSLRAERLSQLAAIRHAELLAHGCRLRRERAEIDRVVDREGAERDRVRTRLRRVNEFRDQAARAEAKDAAARATQASHLPRPGAVTEWGLATCAGLLLATLVLYLTQATGDPDRSLVTVGLGLATLVSISSYFAVAGRGPDRARGRASDSAAPSSGSSSRTWRDALRHRFADLSDPDDPELPRRLRERLAALDDRLAPVHARLEGLDDTITVFDVEAGRAARALHLPLPEPELAEEGLPEGMDVRAATRLVHDLGDAVYATTVERDALRASGVGDRDDAEREVAAALRALAGGRSTHVEECQRRIDAFDPAPEDDSPEDALADALLEEVTSLEALASEPPSQPTPSPPGSRDAADSRDGNSPRFVVLRSVPDDIDPAEAALAVRAADPSIQQVVVAVRGGGAAPAGSGASIRQHPARGRRTRE